MNRILFGIIQYGFWALTLIVVSLVSACGGGGDDEKDGDDVSIDDIGTLKEPTVALGAASLVINNNAEYAVVNNELAITLKAAGDVKITGYIVTEHNATDDTNIQPMVLQPLPTDSRWTKVKPTANLNLTVKFHLAKTYKLGDVIQLCAWFKDDKDDVSEKSCDTIIYSVTWESDWGSWSADNGVWSIGTPGAGPSGCYSGDQCAGTALDGNYGAHTDSRLISPSTILPTVDDKEEIHLRFQHWFSYAGGDWGEVHISVWDTSNQSWSEWEKLSTVAVNTSSWSMGDVDLTAFAGKTVRIAFYHTASRPCCSPSDRESTGWYIDDIRIVKEVPISIFSGDFETGWDNWGTDRGVWSIGTPSAGPSSCYNGDQCAGTALDGNYGAYTDSRLISPSTILPTVDDMQEIHLRFQHWFSYAGGDWGEVHISVWDTTNQSWSEWEKLNTVAVNTSSWSMGDVDLTAFAGKTVRIAFYHTASRPCCSPSDRESTGWYIDDVVIQIL